jgi:hypothetical protein
MSNKIAACLLELKDSLFRHGEAYPGSRDRTKLSQWRDAFDYIRADIERLEHAGKNSPSDVSVSASQV